MMIKTSVIENHAKTTTTLCFIELCVQLGDDDDVDDAHHKNRRLKKQEQEELKQQKKHCTQKKEADEKTQTDIDNIFQTWNLMF